MTNDTTRHKRFKHLSFKKLTNEKQHIKINKLYYDKNQETNHKIKFNFFRKLTITAENSTKCPDTQTCATKTHINRIP